MNEFAESEMQLDKKKIKTESLRAELDELNNISAEKFNYCNSLVA